MSLDVVLDRRLLIISGKGGVGKTTVAAALGVLAESKGKRVLLCEVEGKDALAATFDQEPLDDTPRQLMGELYGMNISPERALEEYFETQLHMKRIAKPLVTSQLVYYVTHAAPGLRDILMLGKVWYEATRKKTFDLIVLDTAAAGHAFSMLRSPEGFLTAVPVGPLANHARQVAEWLKSPDEVALHLVTLPEEMPINETIETAAMLEDKLAIGVAGVFVNMMYPAISEDKKVQAQLESWRSPDDVDAPAETASQLFGAVDFYRQRRNTHLTMRETLSDAVGSVAPVAELPYLFCDRFGIEQLRELASAIERQMS